jgi:hypothetical protein
MQWSRVPTDAPCVLARFCVLHSRQKPERQKNQQHPNMSVNVRNPKQDQPTAMTRHR